MKNYQEVSPKRLEEYNSIVDEVDKRAKPYDILCEEYASCVSKTHDTCPYTTRHH